MSSPLAQTQSPPQNRKVPLLETFWRRFCLYVAASEGSYLHAVYISALQMGILTVFNCRLE